VGSVRCYGWDARDIGWRHWVATLGGDTGWRRMRTDRGDGDSGDDSGDGRPDGADAPREREAERAGLEDGDNRPAPGDEADEAVRSERAAAYPDQVHAVYRAYAIDQGCAEVEKIETDTVTPAMLRIEAEDPDRRLAGFENRLKEKDRLSQYKWINSRWRVPENGQLFEVQFHTEASYAAKEETHPAYEKLRVGVPTKAEQRELEEFQKQVTARVPIPSGAAEIPDYP
jgi:hypothetical protein